MKIPQKRRFNQQIPNIQAHYNERATIPENAINRWILENE
jgi:hypothetical protein